MAIASAKFGKAHGHPSKDVVDRLLPYTVESEPHRFRMWEGKSDFIDRPQYREAIYSTATNGTIVLVTNGTTYSVTPETQ